jgi:hypothetical protein
MVKSSPCTTNKKRAVSEKKAVHSIACVMEHAEDADLKYIIKVLNESPKMKPVLAGLLRDGTFQKSIELKGSVAESTMLPPRYKRFKQLGVRWMLDMVAEWEEGLVPGQRLPGKVRKSQKVIMNEVLSLLAYALHMKMDAKLPSHDGNKVKAICKLRYIAMGRRLQTGSFDYSFKDQGHYTYDSQECNIIVNTLGDKDDKPRLTLSLPEDFLKGVTDFTIVNNHSLQEARLKSASADLDVHLSSLFQKQFPEVFVEEVEDLPGSVFEEEELAMQSAVSSDEGLGFHSPLKTTGAMAMSPAALQGEGSASTANVVPPPPPPLGDGDAGEAETPQ